MVSGVRMIQHLVPAMRERGWGRVITIGGGLASQPMNTHPQYNATLAARHNLAVSLARDLKGTGVTSNVVSPERSSSRPRRNSSPRSVRPAAGARPGRRSSPTP